MTGINTKKALIITDGSWDHASSRTRALLYFSYFKRYFDLTIHWIPRVPLKKRSFFNKYVIFPICKRLLLAKQILYISFFRYEFIYIQRYYLKGWIINFIKRKGIKIVFDFDDAIFINFPGQEDNGAKTIAMLTAAQLIIVSSSELADYCFINGFNNVLIINTPVETERFKIRSKWVNQNIRIGWIGSPFTSNYLKTIEHAIEAVCKKYNTTLLLIGAQEGFSMEGVEIEQLSWSYSKEPELLERMDIGIMPLNNDEYSKGKGGYKLFQYMAAGLPIIASPVGINSEIVIQGQNGFLAESTEEWIQSLSFLIEHPEERERMGINGRKLAEEKYSREYCFNLLFSYIKPLL